MEVRKICQWCGKPFIAKKTTTCYCSHQCSNLGYKGRIRERKRQMRKMQEFVNTEKYGKLYIDRILFESNFPIIFTCKNDADEIFICVCCQNNIKGCKWLVGKTDAINIIRMLKDELTLRELVRGYSSGRISVDYIDG